jgi:hypothetical protein
MKQIQRLSWDGDLKQACKREPEIVFWKVMKPEVADQA